MILLFVRSVLLYIFVILALRLMGKRQIGELQPSELVVTLLISDIASVPMQEMGIPLLQGVVPIFALVMIELLLSGIMLKSNWMRKLIAGKPIIIIENGKILQAEMRRVRYSIEDLIEDLRLQGYFKLEDISWAIVETNGKLSVKPKTGKEPAPAEAMGITIPDDGFQAVIINDGQIYAKSLQLCGVDEKWLNQTLKQEKKQAKDIFVMTANQNKQYVIIPKEAAG